MTKAEQILQIPLEKIGPHPGNRRVGGFDKAKLEQLAESIRAVGVQQPAVVRKAGKNGRYELVAGERRWRAAKMAGLKALPCVVRDLDDVQVLKIQTIENLQREDIHPLDEADGYARLIDVAKYDVEAIAQEVGKSASYVYQRLKLRDLVPPARKALVEGKISAGHAILIARLEPRLQPEALKPCLQMGWHAREEGATVRELGDWIQRELMLDLGKAAFQKDDAELLPKAGACTACPKRTGYQPALFADICKGDHCMDARCYGAKLDALVDRRRKELKEEEHFEAAAGHLDYNLERQLPEKIKRRSNWQEAKKTDKAAKRVLIAAGPDRGRLTWGVERKQYSSGRMGKTPAEIAREKAARQEQQEKSELRRALWDRIMETSAARLKAETLMPLELIRLVVKHIVARTWSDTNKRLCSIEGWERPPLQKGQNAWDRPDWKDVVAEKVQGMDAAELEILLLKLVLVPNLSVSSYGDMNPRILYAAADILGIEHTAPEPEEDLDDESDDQVVDEDDEELEEENGEEPA